MAVQKDGLSIRRALKSEIMKPLKYVTNFICSG